MIGGGARPVVLAAPSGTGKTTIARRLVADSDDFVFSVSVTTRPPRPGERDGEDYRFVDDAAFDRMVEEGELVEWAEVHGRLYGTPFRNIEESSARGDHVVLDIDVQGARQIRDRVPNAVRIFLLPPSAEALVERLGRRGTEGRAEILHRLRNAKKELAEARHFEHVVVNDDLEVALRTVRGLARSEPRAMAEVDDVEERVRHLTQGIDEMVRTLEE